MKLSKSLVVLTAISGVLALLCSLAGLLLPGGSGPFEFTSVHGQPVQIYGNGLYETNPAFTAPIYRGTDLVTVFAAVPLLFAALAFARYGSMKSGLLLLAALSFMLYNSASLSLGVSYNIIFPVYIAYFSTSLFAFILAFTSLDSAGLAQRITGKLPHGWVAGFLIFAGAALLFVWGMDIVEGYTNGRGIPTAVQSYTTLVTHTLDLGIISPMLFLTGILLLQRKPIAYPLSAMLLVLCSLIGLVVAGQTVAQVMDGVVLSPAEWAAKVIPFLLMALVSGGLAARFFQGIQAEA